MSDGEFTLGPGILTHAEVPARLHTGLPADEAAGCVELLHDDEWTIDFVAVWNAETDITTLIPVEPVQVPAGRTVRVRFREDGGATSPAGAEPV